MLQRNINFFRKGQSPADCDEKTLKPQIDQKDEEAMPILRHWADIPAQLASQTVSKRQLDGVGADLVRVDVKAGAKASRHSHAHEQFVQVISGSGWLETEEGRQPFSAGSLFHFPADTWHAAEFDADTVLVETNFKVA